MTLGECISAEISRLPQAKSETCTILQILVRFDVVWQVKAARFRQATPRVVRTDLLCFVSINSLVVAPNSWIWSV